MINDNDITTDPLWQVEQMDRLLAWEILQNAMGRGGGYLTDFALADRLAIPPAFWHVMIRRIKRRLADAQ